MTETESRTPIPDPTVLTTQQLLRELELLKELLGFRIGAVEKGIDKAERATQVQLEQQRIAGDAVERSLREQILTLDSRMTRSEAAAAGRSQITAPVWGLVGAVATGVLVSVVLAFLGAKEPAQAPTAILMPSAPIVDK
jgi:hypothetical protein